MTVLLHLSDTHFGTERPAVVEALLDWVRAQRPALVVLSGDVTQRARRAQFDAARGFVERLGAVPTLAIPGNHDIPLFDLAARALHPYDGYVRAFGATLEPVHETPALLVVAVNTTRAWRHKHGQVSPDQVQRVAQRLQRATPAQLRVVVVHHPIAVTDRQDERDLLRGHALAMSRWAQAGADLVLGGHIHLPFVLALHERRPRLARRLWAVQAGTAVSHRVRPGVPNSVNLIRWGDGLPAGLCVVERWDHGAEAGRFVPAGKALLHTGWPSTLASEDLAGTPHG